MIKDREVSDILYTCRFPHRFLAYFASQVAKESIANTSNPDPKSILAIEIAERWGLGEDFDLEYLRDTRRGLPVFGVLYYALCVCIWQNPSLASTYVLYAISASGVKSAKPLFFKCIKERMSRVEQLLILGEEIS